MPHKPNPGLTLRQRKFVELYVECRNGAEAARRAGYSKDTCKQIAYNLLRKPEVRAAVREHEEADERLRGEERRYVLNSLRELADRARQAEPVRNAKGRKVGVYRFDGATAVRALELLGKQEGLFREQLEVRVQAGVEELLDRVQPLISQSAYAELVTAIAQITGVAGVGAAASTGDQPGAVH